MAYLNIVSSINLALVALLVLCNTATVHNIAYNGSRIDNDQYYIAKMVKFNICPPRLAPQLVPLKYRLHVIEDPNRSIADFCFYFGLHESSCELLRNYVQNNLLKLQNVTCSVPFGDARLDLEWNVHLHGDLKEHLERICDGLSSERGVDALDCVEVAYSAMVQRVKILQEHYESTKMFSLNQMGIWPNRKGLEIVDPFLYFNDRKDDQSFDEAVIGDASVSINPARVVSRPSLHILIATMGRPQIFGMLASLSDLEAVDFVTIVFDGFNDEEFILAVREYADRILLCKVNTFVEYPNALGFHGHGVRNRYKQLEGDFVMHVDDDDIVLPGSIEKIKTTCLNTNTVYVFRMRNKARSAGTWHRHNSLRLGNIGTPCGVIPTWINAKGRWGLTHGGDFMFYTSVVPYADEFVFVDFFIYLYPKL
jgi:hypothetical protein